MYFAVRCVAGPSSSSNGGAAFPAVPTPVSSSGGSSASGSNTLDETMDDRCAHVDSDMAIDGKLDEEFICSICTFVMREPHLVVKCGHHFCKSCLNKYRATYVDLPLPR